MLREYSHQKGKKGSNEGGNKGEFWVRIVSGEGKEGRKAASRCDWKKQIFGRAGPRKNEGKGLSHSSERN